MSMLPLPLILQAGAGDRLDIISLILNASPVVKGVMVLLIGMSVASWFVIGSKSIYLSNAANRSMRFQDMFWKTGRLDDIWRATEAAKPSPGQRGVSGGVHGTGQAAKAPARAVQRSDRRQRRSAGRHRKHPARAGPRPHHRDHRDGKPGATAGNDGQRRAVHRSVRHGLGHHELVPEYRRQGAANLATVAPGIAEALVATAIGLMAAIPAVMAYNYFSRRIRVISSEMETFSSDFLNIVRRRFF